MEFPDNIIQPYLDVTSTLGYPAVTPEYGNFESIYRGLVDEQKAYNQLQMEREDTAYQRMVADLKKAGLNPWSGISTGGSSSSSMVAPNKSAFSTLLQALDNTNKAMDRETNGTLGAVKTGASIALGILGLFF